MLVDEGKYYLYRHIRLDKNEPFYIGIGTKRDRPHHSIVSEYERAYVKNSRNNYWKNIVNSTNYKVEILLESNNYAFIKEKEVEFIASYNTLCNMTEGGEGTLGLEPWNKGFNMWENKDHPNKGKKLSKETCVRKSKSMKHSDKNLKGKKLSDEWRKNISKGVTGKGNSMYGKRGQEMANARFVLDTEAGIFWESVTEAAEVYNFKMKTLYNKLKGHRKNNTNLILL